VWRTKHQPQRGKKLGDQRLLLRQQAHTSEKDRQMPPPQATGNRRMLLWTRNIQANADDGCTLAQVRDTSGGNFRHKPV
jgi:hypothetical protein